MKLREFFFRLFLVYLWKNITINALLLFTSIVFIGCSHSAPIKTPNLYPIQSKNVFEASHVPEYKLGFGDVVEIKFFNNSQFNEVVSVRPDGRITMEKIGDIFVNGMTPSQLDSLVTTTYADIIINPDVTVFVRQFGGYKVYVLGEVNTPGGYALERNMTVLQVFASAGGLKNTAKINNVMVLRQGDKGTIDARNIDLTDFLDGEKMIKKDVLFLEPQDIVFVPSTFFADVNTFLKQVYDGLLPPVDIYLRALWWNQR